MDSTLIRPAEPSELGTVADLRWKWALENDAEPTLGYEEFVRHCVGWARENASSHRCLVALRDNEVVGMGWLAVTRRVPAPHAPDRASGDVQCVYVVPGLRNTGLGGQLIDALLALARQLGLERVTVHSSVRAVPAYTRRGFDVSAQLLQADTTARTGP